MLPFEEARGKLLAQAKPLAAERIGVDAAAGRVLAEDVVAPFDLPRFDYSSMDGYAVRVADLQGAGPWRLAVHAESKPGEAPSNLELGKAARIFTGAEIPQGADAVVMQEEVERTGEGATFRTCPHPGAYIRARGDDLRRDAIALRSGTRLRPSHLALAAACDRAWLRVARSPVVTLLGTGDELRLPGSSGKPGMIPESNGIALRAMAAGAGAIPRVLPFVGDDRKATETAIADALVGTDVLVTVGGVSVGVHDHVRPALEAVGVVLEFWKVAQKPGMPFVVGRKNDAMVLGLPGNPCSAMVTFALYGVPLLRALQGDAAPIPTPDRGRLTCLVERQPGRTEFLRARAERRKAGGVLVTPLANQASGAVTSMAEANALIVVEAERGRVCAGEEVDVLWMTDLGA